MQPAELLAEHRVSLKGHVARYTPHFILGGIFAALGLSLLAIDQADEQAGTFWPGVVIAAFALLFVVPVVLGYRQRIGLVQVLNEGIGWTVGAAEEYRAWDDFRELYRSWKPVQLRLVFKRKETLTLDPTLEDFYPLVSLLEALTMERLLPGYRAALDQGGADFGPILLKRDSLRINQHDFAWSAIEEYAIVDGGIVVTPFAYDDFTGEHVSFELIPNYLILLRLLEETGHRPTPAEQCIKATGRTRPS